MMEPNVFPKDLPRETDEEWAIHRAKTMAQMIEALSSPHVEEARSVLGQDATDDQIVLWFILHRAGDFREDWEKGVMSPLNHYYAAINTRTDPDPMTCYTHYVANVPPESLLHHRDLRSTGKEV